MSAGVFNAAVFNNAVFNTGEQVVPGRHVVVGPPGEAIRHLLLKRYAHGRLLAGRARLTGVAHVSNEDQDEAEAEVLKLLL